MTHPISLAHLTVIDLAPPRMIRLAADLGYDRIGAVQPRLQGGRVGFTGDGGPAVAGLANHRAQLPTGFPGNQGHFVEQTVVKRVAAQVGQLVGGGADFGQRPLHFFDLPAQ